MAQLENLDPLAGFKELAAAGPMEGVQAGYVKDGNCWHKALYRKPMLIRGGTLLAAITHCKSLNTECGGRNVIATPQIYAEPLDHDPLCEDCDDPDKAPPLCEYCGDPMCVDTHD